MSMTTGWWLRPTSPDKRNMAPPGLWLHRLVWRGTIWPRIIFLSELAWHILETSATTCHWQLFVSFSYYLFILKSQCDSLRIGRTQDLENGVHGVLQIRPTVAQGSPHLALESVYLSKAARWFLFVSWLAVLTGIRYEAGALLSIRDDLLLWHQFGLTRRASSHCLWILLHFCWTCQLCALPSALSRRSAWVQCWKKGQAPSSLSKRKPLVHSSRHDTACCVNVKTRLGENDAMWLTLPVKRGRPPGADALWFVHLSPVGMVILCYFHMDFRWIFQYRFQIVANIHDIHDTQQWQCWRSCGNIRNSSGNRPSAANCRICPESSAQSLPYYRWFFSLNAVYMTASFPGELEFIFSLEEHWIQYTPWEIDGDNIISMRIFWGCSLFWERRVMFTSLCLLCSQQFLNSVDFAHLSGTTSLEGGAM